MKKELEIKSLVERLEKLTGEKWTSPKNINKNNLKNKIQSACYKIEVLTNDLVVTKKNTGSMKNYITFCKVNTANEWSKEKQIELSNEFSNIIQAKAASTIVSPFGLSIHIENLLNYYYPPL